MSTRKLSKQFEQTSNSIEDLCRKGNFEEALSSANRLLKEAKSSKIEKYIGIGNFLLGNSLYELQKFSEALHPLKRSIEYFNEKVDNEGQYRALVMYGTSLIHTGEPKSAFLEYEKALKISIKLENKLMEIGVRNNMANIFSEMGNPKSAVQQLKLCRDLAKKNGEQNMLATILGNLAGNLSDIGEVDSAIETLWQSIEIFRKIDDKHGEGRAFDLLSRLSLSNDKFDEAIEYNTKAKEIFENIKSVEGIVATTSGLSHIYDSQGKTSEAIQTCKFAIELVQKYKFKMWEIRFVEFLSELYEKQNKYFEANKYLKEYIKLKKDVFNEQTNQLIHQKQESIERLQIELETEQKERENAELKMDIEQRDRDLTTKAMHLLDKQETLSEILLDVERLNKSNVSIHKSQLNNLLLKLNNLVTSSNEWDEFEIWFKEVYGRFYRTLKEQFPKLSQREQKVCAFLKLRLQTKDIAGLTNLTPKTIEVYRTNIRKKLNLSRSQNLSEFMQNL